VLHSPCPGLLPSGLRALIQVDCDSDGFLVDVQTEVMHDFIDGCLVSFIDDESGAIHSRDSRIADRSAHADNPRQQTEIKHLFDF
jgi:hypothetical protein